MYMPFFVSLFPFYPYAPYPGIIGPFPYDESLRIQRFWWWYLLNRPAATSTTGAGATAGAETAAANPAAFVGPEVETATTARAAAVKK